MLIDDWFTYRLTRIEIDKGRNFPCPIMERTETTAYLRLKWPQRFRANFHAHGVGIVGKYSTRPIQRQVVAQVRMR